MSRDPVVFELVVPDSEADRAVLTIEAEGGTVRDDPALYADDAQPTTDAAFEPLVLVVSLVAATKVLQLIQRIWREFAGKGSYLIVDTRGGKVSVRKVNDRERATMLVITEDNQVSVQRPTDDDPSWKLLVDSLTQLQHGRSSR